jgi:hypothetical protein
MCSTGTLLMVLNVIWFVSMGLACFCCCIGLICFKDKMNDARASMTGGMK